MRCGGSGGCEVGMSDRLEDSGCNHSGRIVDSDDVLRCGCGEWTIPLQDYIRQHDSLQAEVERLRALVDYRTHQYEKLDELREFQAKEIARLRTEGTE